MAASDYDIVCGCFSAYIAKSKKRPSKTMSSDRAPISEETILMLIDWYLDSQVDDDSESRGFSFKSVIRPGHRVSVRFEAEDNEAEAKQEVDNNEAER